MGDVGVGKKGDYYYTTKHRLRGNLRRVAGEKGGDGKRDRPIDADIGTKGVVRVRC